MLDRVFGRENFLNEIIWAYDFGGRAKDKWPAKHDNILFYVKNAGDYVFNREEIDREPYMAPGLVGKEKAERGNCPPILVAYHCRHNTAKRPATHSKTCRDIGAHS
jgi:site-specific DNA-methyltransferase (adenine-specific)